ncbi:MAG: hypothetical protein K8I27_16770 [Planctomycetes bacterium]|nr:hypothetical protein [Planctomycetota bacterium]
MRLLLSLLLLLCVGELSATSAVQLDVAALTEKSSLVVVGKVDSSECKWDAAKAGIWTHYDLTVTETLKGAHEKSREVVIRGGVVGEVGQHVAGAGSLETGAEYVLFLWKDDDDRLRLQGMRQGVFQISEREGVKYAGNSLSGLRIVDPETMKVRKASALEFELTALKTKVKDLVGAAKEDE